MQRFAVLCLVLCLFCFSRTSSAQSNQYYIKLNFNEWMDTTGFANPDNFIWSGGLVTISSGLIDTSTALLRITQPEPSKWYNLRVCNVYDIAGNLIDSDCDTAGFVLKPASLPVELSSFTAKIINEKVHLTWITETEVNNYGFDIERIQLPLNPVSEGQEQRWINIGFVEGYGNSNSPKYYSFDDNDLIGGTRFKYRLKQIDTDGNFNYSDEVEIEIIPDKFALFQNYPNPFNPSTKIRYQLPEASKVEIKIYDIKGEKIFTLLDEKKEAGIFEKEFNADNLASGVYLYHIIAESVNLDPGKKFIETKKMILLK
jgi:Secretion system C-terminal sorting domain